MDMTENATVDATGTAGSRNDARDACPGHANGRTGLPLIAVQTAGCVDCTMPEPQDAAERIVGDENRRRLHALLTIFDISIQDAADAAQMSRSIVSRIIHGDARVNPSHLYRRLEKALPALIDKRRRQYFQLESTPVETIEKALDGISHCRN